MPNSSFEPASPPTSIETSTTDAAPVQPKARKPRTKPPEPIVETVVETVTVYLPQHRPAKRLPKAHAIRLRTSAWEPPVVSDPPLRVERTLEIDMNTKRIVEAILFATNKPMTIKQIQETFPELERPDTLDIQLALQSIAEDYAHRPIGLKMLASGYRFQVREGLSPWVSRLFEEKPPRYSRALLETLAIIAYRQPVTRGEIEDIRGVSVSSGIIQTLLEREWIRVIAHKEVPGRPALYGTTKQFLDYFNLASLNELPTLQEISDIDFANPAPSSVEQASRENPETVPIQNQADMAEQQTANAATEESGGSETAQAEGHTLH